jgi:hypothetical protein
MNEATELPRTTPGNYPWDEWQQRMIERGMERTLTDLGRDVLRDADQHNWAEPLRQLCYEDSLSELLLSAPYLGRRICEILIETDGLRVAYIEDDKKDDIIRLSGFGGCY